MFVLSSKSIKTIALVLPLTFVWSWAACSLLCSEIVGHQRTESASIIKNAGESGLNAPDEEECLIKSTAAILETKQTFITAEPEATPIDSLIRREYLFAPASIYKADTNQNSPPPPDEFGPPLFLRHRAFRI